MRTAREPAPDAGAVHCVPDAAHMSGGGGVAALSMATLLASLGTSSANVTLPSVAVALSPSFGAVQWVVLSYLVAMTAFAVIVGRVADAVGQRPVLVAGLLVFSGASFVCGIAPGLAILVAARAVQGAGAAAMIAVPLAMVPRIAAQDRIGSVMGLLGTMSAIGPALGPAVGGVLVGVSGWQGVFLANVPFGLAAALAAGALLPSPQVRATSRAARFDGPGAILLFVALAAYASAMSIGRGASIVLPLGLAGAAAVATVLFIRVERKAPSPVVPMATLRKGVFRAGYLASAVVSSVVMATLVVGPFYLSGVLGLDAAGIGLAMACGPAVSALVGVPAGRMVDRFGGRRIAQAGLVAMLLASLSLAVFPGRLAMASGYLAPVVLLTAGYALFQAANNTTIMTAAGAEARGTVSGMLSLSRNLGLITGAALLGAIYSTFAGATWAAQVSPDAILDGMHAVFAASAILLAAALVGVRLSDRTI